jgi:hypothetical protein
MQGLPTLTATCGGEASRREASVSVPQAHRRSFSYCSADHRGGQGSAAARAWLGSACSWASWAPDSLSSDRAFAGFGRDTFVIILGLLILVATLSAGDFLRTFPKEGRI